MRRQASGPGLAGTIWRSLFRLALRLSLAVAMVFAASLAAGGFLPVASTLMFGHWLAGKPVNRVWVPLEAIAPALIVAVIAAEDQRFCAHWGVDFSALLEVLEDEEGPTRGASTISMQLAKNLYLWPGRSYLRKALEIPLALVLDLAWGKRRVMEAYLNIAEWGEGIFGAEAAARHHFGKGALALSNAEAARLAAVLPNPILRDPRRPGAVSRRVLARMAQATPLSRCVLAGG
jgi:monofunctional biosynthetic peptidoglycan transglycosylase